MFQVQAGLAGARDDALACLLAMWKSNEAAIAIRYLDIGPPGRQGRGSVCT
jgi:hypothetical protein